MNIAERKITKMGNSFGITLPAELLEDMGLVVGDFLSIDKIENTYTIKKTTKVSVPSGLTQEFFDILNRNYELNREALDGLKDR